MRIRHRGKTALLRAVLLRPSVQNWLKAWRFQGGTWLSITGNATSYKVSGTREMLPVTRCLLPGKTGKSE